MGWQNIYTDDLRKLLPKAPSSLFSILFLLFFCSCATHREEEAPRAQVPESPSVDHSQISFDALIQGLAYVRQHPATREEEQVQRYLWLDQWIRVLQDKGRLTPEMGREYWEDLDSFVKNPPMSLSGFEKLRSSTRSRLGLNIALFNLYQGSLRDQSLETSLGYLSQIEDDGISDFYARAQELLQLTREKAMTESRKVGVLIPLSGDLRAFGEEVMSAVQLVSYMAYADGIEFIIEDSGSTKESLIAAWQKLALQEKVTVIVGPLKARDT